LKRTQRDRIQRARPLLGTRVDIAVAGLSEKAAHRAIDAGFAEIAHIHTLMSFHEADSDVSRLNASACIRAVAVQPETFAVVRESLRLAEASRGVFDITVAARLVAWGFLPRPASRRRPDPRASWRDIELIGENRIRFRRPLWIDLGGIAKGYAVDRAIARMATPHHVQVCVNAGGDLRVRGPQAERVLLRAPSTGGMVPIVELQDGSIASSSGRESRKIVGAATVGPHVHGLKKAAMGTRSFVSVVAAQCIIADGLTKVALAKGAAAARILKAFDATAYHYTPNAGWRTFGACGVNE
jgi:thiamine biosynthesis lipoprotein